MNPYNQRKEPTFGEQPTAEKAVKTAENAPLNNPEQSEKDLEKSKISISLHTKNAPNYTFTPVMKRPKASAKILSTLEEQAEQTMSNEQNSQNTTEADKLKSSRGFTFPPVVENQPVNNNLEESKSEEPSISLESPTITQPKTEQQDTEQPIHSTIERVIPMAATAATIEKVPSKYRRLLIVLLLLLVLFLAFFLLKPNTPESVENLQEQGASLPIEFRPVDEEEAKRAEAEAKALQETQAQQQAQTEQAQMQQPQIAQPTETAQAVENTAQPVVTVENSAPQTQQVITPASAVVAVKPEVQRPVAPAQTAAVKPSNSASVIYQPETPTKVVKASPQPKPQVKAEPVAKVQPKSQVAPVVKAEPVKIAESATSVASKTMTVPKGVSLMQVFRDNNLNIADVNAMSKANSIVSKLKVGEKITVRLDKNNRVTEMSISSGGKFIRQANGSYIYK